MRARPSARLSRSPSGGLSVPARGAVLSPRLVELVNWRPAVRRACRLAGTGRIVSCGP